MARANGGRTGGGVAVIGAGAIGGLVAARLASAGLPVHLCVRTAIPGLVLESGGERIVADVEVITRPEDVAGTVDWIFLATKAHDTDAAAPWLARLCGPGTTLVVLQNGIDAERRLTGLVGPARIIPTLVHIGAERLAPGHIVQHGGGQLVVPQGKGGEDLAALLAGTVLVVKQVADFLTYSWRKILGNVFANPLTALTMRRADVFDDPDVAELARKLVAEAVEVGRSVGARLTPADVETTIAGIAQLPKGSGSSMLYDRLAGLRLEHEHLTGAVVRTAELNGIDVPYNRVMLTLLRALDEGLSKR